LRCTEDFKYNARNQKFQKWFKDSYFQTFIVQLRQSGDFVAKSNAKLRLWTAPAKIRPFYKWTIIIFLLIIYFLAFPRIVEQWGDFSRIFVVIFVIPIVLFWGLRGGIIISLLAPPAMIIFYKASGVSFSGGAIGPLFLFLIAIITGQMRDLSLKLEEELNKKDQAELKLQKHQASLEKIMGERTAQLSKANIELQREISERRLSEDALRESKTQLQTLLRAIPDLVWLKDIQGIYLFCNFRFEQFFGAKEADIVGKTDYDFVDRELADFFRKNDNKAMNKRGPSINEEEVIFADDGHREILETIKTPVYNSDGKIAGVLGIGRNITDRVSLQEQLVQAQKMESVGRLAGGVAHDYNNALSVIMGYTELAMADVNDPTGKLHADLNQVLKAGKRATDITRQLLAFARKQTIAPIVLDLNKNVENMLKMLRRLIGENIDLAWLPGINLWPVKMDPSQIDQILANLCVNAKDAIAGVGKITIETDTAVLDKAFCAKHTGFVPGKFVLLTISDNGCGMDKKILNHIFEPFFTTKDIDKGTGLGLATVYGIIKQNKGFINIYSEPGKGTTINIYLPRHEGKVVEVQREVIAEIPQGNGETILLVEDDRSILKLTQKLLTGLGYKVLVAQTPKKAMGLAKEHTGKIHLIVTDVIMPEMNGLELANSLQSLYPDLKRMFMSGYTANAIAHHGVLDEGVHFIQKPFTKRDLASLVRKVLDGEKVDF